MRPTATASALGIVVAASFTVGCLDTRLESPRAFRFACAVDDECGGVDVCFEGTCVAPELAIPRDAGAGGVEPSHDGGDEEPVNAVPLIPRLAVPDGGPVCAPSGWCWVSPFPRGFSQCSVALAAPGIGFAVLDGQLFRVTAERHVEYIDLETVDPLSSVVATSATSGVVSRRGSTIHFAQRERAVSRALPAEAEQTTVQLVASASGDVWGHTSNLVLNFQADAGRWNRVVLPTDGTYLNAVAATSSDELYALFSSERSLYRYSGGSWTNISDGGTSGFTCLAGNTPEGIFATIPGATATIARASAAGLQPVTTASSLNNSMCVVSENNGDFFGYDQDGLWAEIGFNAQWQRQVPPPYAPTITIKSMSMRGREGIACGPNALFLTLGGVWHSVVSTPSTTSSNRPNPSRLTIGEDGTAYGFGSGQWLLRPTSVEPVEALLRSYVMGRIGPNDYLTFVGSEPRRFDGTRLGPAMPGARALEAVRFSPSDIAIAGPDDIWVSGQGYTTMSIPALFHWDGTTWAAAPVPPSSNPYSYTFDAIEAAGSSVWAQRDGKLYQLVNSTWVDRGAPVPNFYGIALGAISATEVLVGGPLGTMRWSTTSGWAIENATSVGKLATDPTAGTALLFSTNTTLFWRQPNGTWAETLLPGVPGDAGGVSLAIRGQQAWVGSTTGAVFTKQ